VHRARRLRDSTAPPHFNLAVAYAALGKSDEALAEYQTAVELRPGDFKAQEALAIALQEAGRPGDALESSTANTIVINSKVFAVRSMPLRLKNSSSKAVAVHLFPPIHG